MSRPMGLGITPWVIVLCLQLSSVICSRPLPADSLAVAVDSLFKRASAGEIQARESVEPAKQALIVMGQAAVPHLVNLLATRDAREMLTLIDIFKGIGEPAVEALVANIESPEPYRRRLAIRCLGEIGSHGAVGALMQVAKHEDFRTRAEAISALGKIGDPAAASVVASALEDTVEVVATAAAVACGKIRVGIDPRLLLQALSHWYYGVRFSAAASLALLGDEGIDAMLRFLKESSSDNSHALVIEALGKTASKQAWPVLKDALFSTSWAVRAKAAAAIACYPPKQARPVLQKAARQEKHPLVIYLVNQALAKM